MTHCRGTEPLGSTLALLPDRGGERLPQNPKGRAGEGRQQPPRCPAALPAALPEQEAAAAQHIVRPEMQFCLQVFKLDIAWMALAGLLFLATVQLANRVCTGPAAGWGCLEKGDACAHTCVCICVQTQQRGQDRPRQQDLCA